MAKVIDIDKEKKDLVKILQKTVQSCNLNFLLGSGCSLPAIKVLGQIENEVEKLYQDNEKEEAQKKLTGFLTPLIRSTKRLVKHTLNSDHEKTLENYTNFLEAISKLLFERKSHILHKQANIFTTNYDMFIEKAVESYVDTIHLNDGFCRNPSLTNTYRFSSKFFFNTIFNTGNLYKYQVEIPSINFIKIHGSMNWQIKNEQIHQGLDHLENKDTEGASNIIDKFTLVLPRKDKFKETLLNQIYYDLLRIYSNELDKENTLLIAEGFSFADEHIYDLTKRALKNPTLRLIIFSYNKEGVSTYQNKFNAFNNVNIIYSDDDVIDFAKFISIISEILPKREIAPIYNVKIEDSKNE